MEQAQYEARKSAWGAVKAWHILLFFLVVPLIVMICEIITIRKFSMRFYEDKIVIKSGWLNTQTRQMVFMGVTATSFNQSLWGKICRYGDVHVDCVGKKWDVSATKFIKDPELLEEYLQTRIVHMQGNAQNPFIHMSM